MVGDRSCSPTCWLEDDDAFFLSSQWSCQRAFGVPEESNREKVQDTQCSIATTLTICALFGRVAGMVQNSIDEAESGIALSKVACSMQRAPVGENKKGGRPVTIEVMKEGKRKARGWKRRLEAVSLT